MASRYSSIPKLFQLLDDTKALDRELWNKDDRMLEDEYDEDLVRRLKMQVAELRKQIVLLKTRPQMQELRTRERQIRSLEDEQNDHDQLNPLSTKEPERTLRRATILKCAPPPRHEIYSDCSRFKDRVNRYFGLQIALCERILNKISQGMELHSHPCAIRAKSSGYR